MGNLNQSIPATGTCGQRTPGAGKNQGKGCGALGAAARGKEQQ